MTDSLESQSPEPNKSKPPKVSKPDPYELQRQRSQEAYKLFDQNPFVWFLYYFPHHIRKESPPFHLQLIKASMEHRYLAVAAPRESAKSTMLTFLKPFHSIIFQRKRFIVIVQNTFKKAAMSLDSIKREIAENKHLMGDHRGIKITRDAEGDSIFTHSNGFKTQVLCKGVDQIGSIRGVKFGAYRPDLIIGDDMEDDELVRSAERRQQLQQDFDDALVPAGETGACQYIFIGTILHDDALIAKLVSKKHYPEYKKLFYRARWIFKHPDGTKEPRSLWPEQWTLDDLAKLERDKPTVFAKEYQNDPVAGRNAKFRKEDFRQYKIEQGEYFLHNEYGETISRGRMVDCVPAISCDLAWKEKRESDNCVILPGYLTPNSEILVDDFICGKGLKPNDVSDHLFLMADRLKKMTGQEPAIGFEKAMLENITQWFLAQEMRKRNRFLITKDLVWDSDKITRIETRLISRYAQHVMFHKKGMGDLEYQLTRFPSGVHDDLVDALQGLVQLLQFPRKAFVAANPQDEFETIRRITSDYKKGNPFGKLKSRSGIEAYRSWR